MGNEPKKKKLKIKILTYVRFDSWVKQKPRACLVGGGGEGRGWGQFNETCLDVSVKDLRGFGGYLTNPNPHFNFPQTEELEGKGFTCIKILNCQFISNSLKLEKVGYS